MDPLEIGDSAIQNKIGLECFEGRHFLALFLRKTDDPGGVLNFPDQIYVRQFHRLGRSACRRRASGGLISLAPLGNWIDNSPFHGSAERFLRSTADAIEAAAKLRHETV